MRIYIMDNYYTKYLKYKNKYLELKRANGGIGVMGGSGGVIRGGYLGSEPCPKTFGLFNLTTKSPWHYLRDYNCTFEDLNKKIPKKVDAITYDDFLRTNNKNPQQKITLQHLRERGFTKDFLLEKGFTEDVLNKVWIPLEQLLELKRQRSSAIKIYMIDTQDPTLIEISKDIDGKKLADFIEYSDILNRSTFKYPISDLKKFFSIKDFKVAYPQMHTKNGRFYETPFHKDRRSQIDHIFDKSEIEKIVGEKKLEEKDNTVQLRNLKIGIDKLKSYGYSAEELKEARFSASELKVGGYELLPLIIAEYTNNELKKAGFSATDLVEEGFLISKDDGFTAKELKDDGFSAKELKNFGFDAKELKYAGYSAKEINDAGYTLQNLRDAKFDESIIGIIEQVNNSGLKGVHITAKELKEVGYSAKEINDAKYTSQDLIDANFDESIIGIIEKVNNSGLKGVHITATELKLIGYSAKELKKAGYTNIELKPAGYSRYELSNVLVVKHN